jgi:hypothetical protein
MGPPQSLLKRMELMPLVKVKFVYTIGPGSKDRAAKSAKAKLNKIPG